MQVTNNYLIIEPNTVAEHQTTTGLYVASGKFTSQIQSGKIVQKGHGKTIYQSGVEIHIPIPYDIDNKVYFLASQAIEWVIDGNRYLLLEADSVVAHSKE